MRNQLDRLGIQPRVRVPAAVAAYEAPVANFHVERPCLETPVAATPGIESANRDAPPQLLSAQGVPPDVRTYFLMSGTRAALLRFMPCD
jgi:hypothetical protein